MNGPIHPISIRGWESDHFPVRHQAGGHNLLLIETLHGCKSKYIPDLHQNQNRAVTAFLLRDSANDAVPLRCEATSVDIRVPDLGSLDIPELEYIGRTVLILHDRFHGFRHAASLNGGYLSVINSSE